MGHGVHMQSTVVVRTHISLSLQGRLLGTSHLEVLRGVEMAPLAGAALSRASSGGDISE